MVVRQWRKIKWIRRSSKAQEGRPEIDECLLALEHSHAAHFVTVMLSCAKHSKAIVVLI